jgi:branched-chain amino acid transport system ATP-binding protein
MLVTEHLCKHFGGNRAVDDVSLTVSAGSITGLIGPNGAGKTTLFNLLAGAMKPDSGRILLGGSPLPAAGLASAHHAAGIGRTFQVPRPFPKLTVLQNVMLGASGHPGERFWANWFAAGRVRAHEDKVEQAARAQIEFVGLTRLADSPASMLSGGQRKLLELARAMMGAPRLLLLDEPAAGVNPALLEIIVQKLRALHAQGMTFVLIEHNMDLIGRLCDPVVVLAQGRVLAQGSAAAMRSDSRVVDAYLGAMSIDEAANA